MENFLFYIIVEAFYIPRYTGNKSWLNESGTHKHDKWIKISQITAFVMIPKTDFLYF